MVAPLSTICGSSGWACPAASALDAKDARPARALRRPRRELVDRGFAAEPIIYDMLDSGEREA
jgi:hypothetical protein